MLSEYVVSNVISFLTTARDGLTAIRERDSRMQDTVESGVLVSLPSRLGSEIVELGFISFGRWISRRP